MPWISQRKSDGTIFEMQDINAGMDPVKAEARLRENVIGSGLNENDFTYQEVTKIEYENIKAIDPKEIAAKARHEDERDISNKKVLLSVLFDMANQIRALEGKNPVTKRQFIDNLKSRR